MHLTFTMSDSAPVTSTINRAALLTTSQFGREAAGNGLQKCVVSHLQGLGPNKRFPAATTGFYKDAAESVSAPELTSDGAQVSITQVGMRQRYLGGVIRQNTPGKTYLTIPNDAYTYGKLAPEFSGLKFAFVRNEDGYLAPALVATDLLALGPPKKRRKKGTRPVLDVGDVAYWLVRQVNQNPDPSVLPTEGELADAVVRELTDLVRSWLSDPFAEVSLS